MCIDNWIFVSGAWEENCSMALVICCVHNSSVFSMDIFLHCQWLDIRLQYLYMPILGTFDHILHLGLASGLFSLCWVERLIEIRRLGTSSGNIHVLVLDSIYLCIVVKIFSDGNHGFCTCFDKSIFGRIKAYYTLHGINNSLNKLSP